MCRTREHRSGGESDSRFPPDVVKIFDQMAHLLIDDHAQNAALPEEIRKVIQAGPAVDELPAAQGEFRRCVTNPIPVNGPIGEVTYLSRLIASSGATPFRHRLGHIDTVDVYETVSIDGRYWDVIFLNYYHPRKSRQAPCGYRLSKPGPARLFIRWTNLRVDGFPLPMEAAIKECMRRILGIPVRPLKVAEILTSIPFLRAPNHCARPGELADLGMESATSYRDAGEARVA